ncbi:unnamed protein product [Schistosoma guineensis]|nr:unnamed protein product [Schistosoma guineensis]
MKCTFSFNLSITIYLIFVLLNKFFECQNISEEIVPLEEEFVIHQNGSHRYSFRFGYLQKISLNHSHPVVNGSFNKFTGTQSFTPEFPFNYFDTEVKRFDFYSTGIISVFKEIYFGLIMGHRSLDYNAEYEVLNSKELLAAKWSVKSEEKDGTQVTSNVTCLIYPDGKISFHYDNIPTKIDKSHWKAKLAHVDKRKGDYEFVVPDEWIKSGMSVEFEYIGTYCPKYNSSEACNNASTLTTTCIWCERTNTCMVITDKDAQSLKVNDSHVEVSTFKPVENLMETTERTDQYSDSKQNETLQCLYVLITLIITSFVLCIGCILGRWLYKRRKSMNGSQ